MAGERPKAKTDDRLPKWAISLACFLIAGAFVIGVKTAVDMPMWAFAVSWMVLYGLLKIEWLLSEMYDAR